MSCRVYLGRLPYGTRESDVKKFFRNYGKLREINLKNGYGFVVRCSDLPCPLFSCFKISECRFNRILKVQQSEHMVEKRDS